MRGQFNIKIETDRIVLRPFHIDDAGSLFAYRRDAATNQYQGWIPKTKQEVEDFIAKIPKQINTPKTWYQLAIIEKSSNQLIGDIGIHFIDQNNQQCELGCTLSKSHHGQGFATEAMSGVIDYLFLKLSKHRIVASIDPQNTASIKMMERLGFRKEGHFIESLFFDGRWVDDVIFGLLSREWENMSAD